MNKLTDDQKQRRREAKAKWLSKHPNYRAEFYLKNRDRLLQRTSAYARAHRDQTRETQRRWRERHPEKKKEHQRKYKESLRGRWRQFEARIARDYGLTVEDYARLELAQGRRCAGCLEPLNHEHGARGVHVDHCHATGKVRGLLCKMCNFAIGAVCDVPRTLRRLAEYLEVQAPELST